MVSSPIPGAGTHYIQPAGAYRASRRPASRWKSATVSWEGDSA